MVLVNCPLMQQDVIREVEKYNIDNKKVFSFVRKEGIKLYFDTTVEDKWEACKVISNIIRGMRFSSAIMFHVVPTDGAKVEWFKFDK